MNALMKIGTDEELFPAVLPKTPPDWEDYLNFLETIPGKPHGADGHRIDMGDGFWCHSDGVSVEYGFAPVTTMRELVDKLHIGKDKVNSFFEMEFAPSTEVDVSPLMTMEHPLRDEVLNLGCSPDYVALPGANYRQRSVPRSVRMSSMRQAGFHIHLSMPPIPKPMLAEYVRAIDDAVHYQATSWDEPRQGWYRKRYLFRFTDYGLEYRSLSAPDPFQPDAIYWLEQIANIQQFAWRTHS